MARLIHAEYLNEGQTPPSGSTTYAKFNEQQLRRGAFHNVVADEAGNFYNSKGDIIVPGRTQDFSTGLWLPFHNTGTKSRLVDRTSNILFTNSAIAGGVVIGTQAPVAIAITTGVVTETGHPHRNGDAVMFGGISGAADTIKAGTVYFVTGATANTYGVASVPNGTALTEAAAHTAIVYSMGRSVLPGAQFNGSDYLQSVITQQWNQQRAIGRLDTLAEDASDCIFIYMELTHGLGAGSGADKTLLAFGRRNTTGGGNGWAISMPAAPAQCKLQFEHCPVGSPSNSFAVTIGSQLALQGDSIGGGTNTGINTKSALAISISKMPKNIGADSGNSGVGGGLFYIECAKLGLTDQGYFGQWNRIIATPPRLAANATSVASFCDTGFTIGMCPGNATATVVNPLAAGQGIDNLIVQRRKRIGAMVCSAVRQGMLNYEANPFAIPVQPACLAS